jgi:hypothetical protein
LHWHNSCFVLSRWAACGVRDRISRARETNGWLFHWIFHRSNVAITWTVNMNGDVMEPEDVEQVCAARKES